MKTRAPAAALAAALLLLAACGRKGAVRPPELVMPKAIDSLEARREGDGITLTWKRPTEYIDGKRLTDLGGFYVERADGDAAVFGRIATIEVTDRERFRQVGRFRFHDRGVAPHVRYRYRLVSFTVDRYVSAPSNEVFAMVPEARATPAVYRSPDSGGTGGED